MRICPECGRRTDDLTCSIDGRMTLDESLLKVEDPWKGKTVAGKYELLIRIGSGGMGSVYRARHAETGGAVAVKLLHPQAALKPQLITRFHLEAQNAASLQHVNTIRVTDFGVDSGSPYLVMEYLDGESLSSLLRRESVVSWRRTAHMVQQLLSSLSEAHAHERRIVHRDIKPANIFIMDQHGQRDFVKVLDFGISRSLEGEGADTRGPIGTPHYMAPEQWRSEPIDGRADLYAVGCIMHEMLSGAPPFDSDRALSPSRQMTHLADQHLNKEVPSLATVTSSEIPGSLASLVFALLHKDPTRRPESALVVASQLAHILDHPEDDGSGWQMSTRPRSHAPVSAHAPVQVDPGSDEMTTIDEGSFSIDGTMPSGAEHSVTQAGMGLKKLPTSSGPAPMEPPISPRVAPVRNHMRWLLPVIALGLIAAAVTAWRYYEIRSPAGQLAVLRLHDAPLDHRVAATDFLLTQRGEKVSLRSANLSGMSLSQRDLSERDLQEASLRRADLKKTDLTGADLRKATLAGADLRGASLRLADLRGADLTGANLTGTGLKGSRYDAVTSWPDGFDYQGSGAVGPNASLSGVDLRGADLRGASLKDANLQRARLKDANLEKASLRGVNARGARLTGAVLRGADLSGADLRGADLRGADLIGAKLAGVNLRGARYSKDTRFPPDFKFTDSGAVGPKANLAKQDLSEQDLRGVDLRGADLRKSKLHGADLRRARLERARLTGARYDRQTKWPTGFDAAHAGGTLERRGERGRWVPVVVPGRVAVAAKPDLGKAPAAAVAAVAAVAPVAAEKERIAVAAVAPVERRRGPTAGAQPARAKTTRTRPPPSARPPAKASDVAASTPAETGTQPASLSKPTLVKPPAGEVSGKNLAGKDLSGYDLSGIDLRWSRYDSRTRWPSGVNPKTSGAIGPGAQLVGRVLRKMHLAGADLRGANLQRADLRGARLIGARLEGADFRKASLQGTDLRAARLKGAKFIGARYDSATRWPTGFEPTNHGAKLTL